MEHRPPALHISKSPSASVMELGPGYWHLEIPAQNRPAYRLAQLDDHASRRRQTFNWHAPLTFELQARVSAQELPGTWGFGFWNDPVNFTLAYNKSALRLPTLPNATWFFHASPQNYLSIRDDLPAKGFLAATFCSKPLPTALLALASPLLALTLLPGTAQWVRKSMRRLVKQDASLVQAQLTEWHTYRQEWEMDTVKFYVDETEILHTNIVPNPPLSLVIWVDNQYAALPPKGGLKYGVLPNLELAWLEIRDVWLKDQS